MPNYILTYSRPRQLSGETTVLFETKSVHVARGDDAAAIRWARDEAPHLYGIPGCDAASVLLRAERQGSRRDVIWEIRPGIARTLLG